MRIVACWGACTVTTNWSCAVIPGHETHIDVPVGCCVVRWEVFPCEQPARLLCVQGHPDSVLCLSRRRDESTGSTPSLMLTSSVGGHIGLWDPTTWTPLMVDSPSGCNVGGGRGVFCLEWCKDSRSRSCHNPEEFVFLSCAKSRPESKDGEIGCWVADPHSDTPGYWCLRSRWRVEGGWSFACWVSGHRIAAVREEGKKAVHLSFLDGISGRILHVQTLSAQGPRGWLPTALTSSPSGTLLALCTRDGSVHVFRCIVSCSPVLLWSLHAKRSGRLMALAFDQTEELLAVAGDERQVQVWRGENLIGTISGPDAVDVRSVAWSQSNDSLWIGSDYELFFVPLVSSGSALLAAPQSTSSVKFHSILTSAVDVFPLADRVLVASGGMNMVHVWKAQTDQTSSGNEHGSPWLSIPCDDLVRSLSFSPMGDHLLCGLETGAICMWSLSLHGCTPNDPRTLYDMGRPVTCLNFHTRTGALVASSTSGVVIAFRSLLDRPISVNAHGVEIWSVAFSPNGSQFVCGSEDQTATVWSWGASEKPIRVQTLSGHTMAVTCVDWQTTATGDRVVTSSDDRTLRVYDSASWNLLHVFRTRDLYVTYCALEPRGCRLVCGTADGWVYIWPLSPSSRDRELIQPLSRMKLHLGTVEGLRWSAVAQFVVSCGSDCGVFLYDPTRTQTNDGVTSSNVT